MAWNKACLSHQMQNFLRQAVVYLETTPSQIIMYTYTFRLKLGLKLSIFSSHNAQFSPARRHATPKTHKYI